MKATKTELASIAINDLGQGFQMFSGTALSSTLLLASCVIALTPMAAAAGLLNSDTAPDELTAQAPMDLPGRPPVDPIEFPIDTPAPPVETPVMPEKEPTEEPAEDGMDLRSETSATNDDESSTAEAEGDRAEVDTSPLPENGTVEDETAAGDPASEERAESVAVPWRKFTNEAGQFRVAMPSQPARYSLSSSPEVEDSQMYMQLQLVDGAYLEIYAAAFVESVSSLRSQANPETALLECVTSLGDLPERSEPRYLPSRIERGVEMTFRGEGGAFQVSRCYLVGDRAYMLTVSRESFDAGAGLTPLTDTAAPTIAVRSAGMDVFFDSFEILNSPADLNPQ